MADDLGERTEDPTQKRRDEARSEGNVARSQDLTGVIMLAIATIAIWAAAMPMLESASIMVEHALDGATLGDPLDPDETWRAIVFIGAGAVRVAAPVLLVAWSAAALGQICQVGWLFSPKAMQPSLSKLNPGKGFKRIFGLTGLVKAGIDSCKVLVVVTVAAVTVAQHAERIVVLPYLPVLQAMAETGHLLITMAIRVLAVLLVLALLDFAYQKWKHTQDLRMTKQQVKDEMKQSEGDPEVKKRRYRMQQQIAMQRISAAVPRADVIVTNPEHIAIALQYDSNRMGAPKVVAKGADFLAMRIRQIAVRHGIPIIERKPLARALYREVSVGHEVPPQFFQAVAEILAYVYRLGGRMAG